MALNLEGIPQLFPHSKEFDQGQGKVRKGAGTFVVALDGSGDFDDIQEAINALPKKGGSIYIKEGTYNINGRITINKSNVEIIGTGRAAHIKSNANDNLFFISDVDNILISGLKIEGDRAAGEGNKGIYVSTSQHTIIQNCYFLNFGGEAIKIPGLCLQMHIIFNEIYDCAGNGITLEATDDLIIVGNRFRGNDLHGLSLTNCDDNIICSNNFLSNGALNTSDGLFLNAYCDENIISSNFFFYSGRYQINISAASCDKNIIMSNICSNNRTGGINDAGTNTHPNGASGTLDLRLDDLNIIA